MIRNISRKEFAARAGLSLRTFDQMVANGQVPTGRKIGSRSFWLEPVVDAWVIRAAGHPYPAPELPEVLKNLMMLSRTCAQLIKIISPCLHELCPLFEIKRMIVSGRNAAAIPMGELHINMLMVITHFI